MKQRKRRNMLLPSVFLAALILTGCGGSGGKDYLGAATSAANGASGWDGAMVSDASGVRNEAGAPSAMPEAPEAEAAAMDVPGGSDVRQPEKIIYTAQLNLETTEFDKASAALEQLAQDLDGFVEAGSVGDRGSGYSWGDYTIRVPAERFNDFLSQAGALCHETWRSVERQNVSESYYDTAGRLKTQQIKLERLQALLKEAEAMADIITIESAISETEWMIEDLSGTLRHYDAQVDYATVHISLQEVYRLSNAEDAPLSFTGRLGAAFSDGLRNFGEGMEDFAVSLAYSWLWILLAAVILAVLIRLIRRKGRIPSLRRRRDRADSNPVRENGDDKSEAP